MINTASNIAKTSKSKKKGTLHIHINIIYLCRECFIIVHYIKHAQKQKYAGQTGESQQNFDYKLWLLIQAIKSILKKTNLRLFTFRGLHQKYQTVYLRDNQSVNAFNVPKGNASLRQHSYSLSLSILVNAELQASVHIKVHLLSLYVL